MDALPLTASWKTQKLGRAFVSLMGAERKIFDYIMAKKFPILKKISSQIYEAKLKEQKREKDKFTT